LSPARTFFARTSRAAPQYLSTPSVRHHDDTRKSLGKLTTTKGLLKVALRHDSHKPLSPLSTSNARETVPAHLSPHAAV
jgi:hypothetical protein